MVTILSFLRSFRHQWQDETFRVIVGLAAGLLLTGTVFYSVVEHWSPLDALYFSVVTLSTVGYGDLSPKTDLGKAFTIVFILVGVGLIVVLASQVVNAMVTDRAERIHRSDAGGHAAGASTTPTDPPTVPPSSG